MRGKASSAMQKTYDDCYLTCSTAIYFESQNNEAEALRSWRDALDQIYYHNAHKTPANYTPKNETERALRDSLRQLELQCKDRVDLLEALRKSRLDAETSAGDFGTATSTTTTKRQQPDHIQTVVGTRHEEAGTWLGDGTVPPLEYSDLLRPALPNRPFPAGRIASNPDTRSYSVSSDHEGCMSLDPAKLLPHLPRSASRTPSPEKRPKMLRTLRKNSKEGKSSKPSDLFRNSPPAAAKAATQAWGSRASIGASGSKAATIDDDVSLRRNSPASGAPGKSRSPLCEPPKIPYATTAAASSLIHNSKPNPFPRRPVQKTAQSPSRTQLSSFSTSTLPMRVNDTNDLHMQSNYTTTALANAKYGRGVTSDLGETISSGEGPHLQLKPLHTLPSESTVTQERASGSRLRQQSTKILPTEKAGLGTPNIVRSTRRESDNRQSGTAVSVSSDAVHENREATHIPSDCASPGPVEQDMIENVLAKLPGGVDMEAAKQILNEIVVHGDEVHWDDIAGLDIAKTALKETVVYPFLRPDLFMGLREPARGMLLFGPPGTGKTMLARAVATESKSTFFAISASSLTSKYLGESEKLVRALFALAKVLAPSIIFVDEIDSLLSSRANASEHEATRRIKTEFLIQWSDLAKAAAGKERRTEKGDASRVLVLAATNLPWAIDEAARRRFVRRQYIPLPEALVRRQQLKTLLAHQKNTLTEAQLDELVFLTDFFSGSDITALAKDAAMWPLRSLGEKLLHMTMEDIRPIEITDFKSSLKSIRPSVNRDGLKEYEQWAKEYGERGG